MVTKTTTNEQDHEQGRQQKRRGRGRKQNPLYSLLVQHPDRASERIIIRICGRTDDPLEERHRRLLEMERYCFKNDILYRWFFASPGREERVLYLTINQVDRDRRNVKCQVSRLHLTSEQVAMHPFVGETTAPDEIRKTRKGVRP